MGLIAPSTPPPLADTQATDVPGPAVKRTARKTSFPAVSSMQYAAGLPVRGGCPRLHSGTWTDWERSCRMLIASFVNVDGSWLNEIASTCTRQVGGIGGATNRLMNW